MRAALLLTTGAVLTACVLLWVRQGDQTGRVHSFLAVFGLAFAAYLVGLHAARGLSRSGVRLALVAAVAWRAALVLAPPLLSDDVYRMVWEGRIQGHGGNPYAWMDRPDAPRWTALRDEGWRHINHKDYTAIYPPLTQLFARAVVAVRDSVTAMKAALVGMELLTLAVLAVLLKRRGQPAERILIQAWSPLALVEIAGSGHNEALGFFFMAASLLALETGQPMGSAVLAALGAQAKLLPGLVAGSWLRRYRVVHMLVAAAVAAALVWPYRGAGEGLWRSLGKYGQYWRFNETGFAVLSAVLPTHAAAVTAAVVLLAALTLALAWRRAPPDRAALAVVAAWLLLSPNVLPWYALWLLPLLVLTDEPAALLLTGTIPLAYLVYPAWLAGQRWEIGWGVRALEYGPCLAVVFASSRQPRHR